MRLLGRAAGGAANAARHPIASAAYAAGMVRGLAGAAVAVASGVRHEHAARGRSFAGFSEDAPLTVPVQEDPHRVPAQRAEQVPVRDDVSPPEPTPLGESFHTEPKATSRASAHGGPADDAEIDAWIDEAMSRGEPDIEVETAAGTTGAAVGSDPDTVESDLHPPGTEPLLDPGVAKAIRSESETLRKAAERDPE